MVNRHGIEEAKTMDERIVVDPHICSGKPTIRGTRIMVKNILGMVAGGYTRAQILDAYPEITPDDVTAALEYASHVVDEEKVIPRA
jgi:uncharacterized protein (DUF433 family)